MSTYGAVTGVDDEEPKDFVKKKRCNDVLFAVLFIAHLAVVITFLAEYKPRDEFKDWTSHGVYKFVGIITLVAITLSTLSLGVMAAFGGLLVEIALIISLTGSLGVGIYGFYIAKLWMGITGGVIFLIGLIFTWCVWKKIDVSHIIIIPAMRATAYSAGSGQQLAYLCADSGLFFIVCCC